MELQQTYPSNQLFQDIPSFPQKPNSLSAEKGAVMDAAGRWEARNTFTLLWHTSLQSAYRFVCPM